MFASRFSPKGGKKFSNLWAGIQGEKNMIFHPEKRPIELEDYWALQIGFADRDIKKGEKIMIKKSDGKYVKELFNMFF